MAPQYHGPAMVDTLQIVFTRQSLDVGGAATIISSVECLGYQ